MKLAGEILFHLQIEYHVAENPSPALEEFFKKHEELQVL